MKRFIDYHLAQWKIDPLRKSLLLKGARQVGKTFAVRQFGKTFDHFVEVNLETASKLHNLFDLDLDPKRIIRDLAIALEIAPINPGKTLLFFDEIQAIPKAIIALRYFYEMMPELHVIGAGSLLDFAIQEVGVPVGRVQFLYMYPVSFIEYLGALGLTQIIEAILTHDNKQEESSVIHEHILRHLAQYLAIGGMPQVVRVWSQTQDVQRCMVEHQSLIGAYRQDFYKYARQKQIAHLTALFDNIPLQFGKKFKYSAVKSDFRSRELSPGLDLLSMANVVQKVLSCNGNGLPIGAGINLDDFKVILLDVGLSQAILGLELGSWILNPTTSFVNKGELVEAFVGQEILAYSSPVLDRDLYYWHRHKDGGAAELDYLIQRGEHIIPIEVKSGKGTTLKSMHTFLESHPKSPYGIRFSTQNYSVHENVRSYPLYAIVKVFADKQQEAFSSLLA